MKRILIALPNDILGGAEQYLKMIASYFLETGASVDVLFLKRKISGAWEDINCDELRLHYTKATSEKYGVIKILSTVCKLRNVKFDYIFTSHLHINSYIGVLIRLKLLNCDNFVGRESTSVFHRYNGIKLIFLKLFYRLGYLRINLLICQTEFMRGQLVNALPWLNKKIKIAVIPNPVNLYDINNRSLNKIAYNNKYKSDNFIVSAGRLVPEKGFDILINAFSDLRNKFKNLKLIILGEGRERNSLTQLLKTLNLENDVLLMGFVENVYPYFRDAKVCVVSSRIEGFPNVLLQMMSQNTSVVSTKCAGGIQEINGVIVTEINDKQSLKNGIIYGLETNSDHLRSSFDSFLAERSINQFIKRIEYYIKVESLKR